MKDKERPGQPKKFEDEELEELLDQDPSQTQAEMAEALGVSQQAICKLLKAIGMVRKENYWVPHELNDRQKENRKLTCEILLQRQQRKGFLHRILTGDEKWIHYDNPKRKRTWCQRGQPSKATAKCNIHGSKIMLCIW